MPMLGLLYQRYGRMRVGLWITLLSFAVTCGSAVFILTELVYRPRLAAMPAGVSPVSALDWLYPSMLGFAALTIVLAGLLIHFGLILPVQRRRQMLEADLSRAEPREKLEILSRHREKLTRQLDATLDDNLALRDSLERADQELEFERDRQQALIRGSAERLMLIDKDCRILVLSPGMANLLSVRAADVTAAPLDQCLRLFDASKEQPLEYPLTQLVPDVMARASTMPSLQEVLLLDQAGREKRLMASVEAILSARGQVSGALLRLEPLDDAGALAAGARAVQLDATTGLPLREQFDRRLEELIRIAGSQSATHGLLLLQLDELQSIYDSLGYWAGEELLWQCARLIRDQLGPGTELFRITAVHFALLLPFEGLEAALARAEQLRLAVEGHAFSWQQSSYRASLTVAVAAIDSQVDGSVNLMEQVDANLRRGRDLGGNRVMEPADDELLAETREIEHKLLAWLDGSEDSSRLHLQSRALLLAEEATGKPLIHAMLRVEMQDGFWIDPVAFLSSAGRHGLMTRIDSWLIERSLAALRGNARAQQDYAKLVVPISEDSVIDEGFAQDLAALIAATGLSGSRLILAVDEAVCRSRASSLTGLLERMRQQEVGLAISNCRIACAQDLLPQLEPELLLLHASVYAGQASPLSDMGLRYLANCADTLGCRVGIAEPASGDIARQWHARGVALVARGGSGLGPIY